MYLHVIVSRHSPSRPLLWIVPRHYQGAVSRPSINSPCRQNPPERAVSPANRRHPASMNRPGWPEAAYVGMTWNNHRTNSVIDGRYGRLTTAHFLGGEFDVRPRISGEVERVIFGFRVLGILPSDFAGLGWYTVSLFSRSRTLRARVGRHTYKCSD